MATVHCFAIPCDLCLVSSVRRAVIPEMETTRSLKERGKMSDGTRYRRIKVLDFIVKEKTQKMIPPG
jgi:hypothetical protein